MQKIRGGLAVYKESRAQTERLAPRAVHKCSSMFAQFERIDCSDIEIWKKIFHDWPCIVFFGSRHPALRLPFRLFPRGASIRAGTGPVVDRMTLPGRTLNVTPGGLTCSGVVASLLRCICPARPAFRLVSFCARVYLRLQPCSIQRASEFDCRCE